MSQINANKTIFSYSRSLFFLIISAGLLSACTTVKEVKEAPGGNYKKSADNVAYSAAAPMRDLNIGTPDIPDQLDALQNPYGTDTMISCAAILSEAQNLQDSLDRVEASSVGNLHEDDTRAGKLGNAADVTTKAIASSLIPFRGIVRLASGATKKEKETRKAGNMGRERLGFLVGIGSARQCPGFEIKIPPLGNYAPPAGR